MADFSQRVVKTERVEFRVPTRGLWVPYVELDKAYHACLTEVRERGLVPSGRPVNDDLIRVVGDDEYITVFYETEVSS